MLLGVKLRSLTPMGSLAATTTVSLAAALVALPVTRATTPLPLFGEKTAITSPRLQKSASLALEHVNHDLDVLIELILSGVLNPPVTWKVLSVDVRVI